MFKLLLIIYSSTGAAIAPIDGSAAGFSWTYETLALCQQAGVDAYENLNMVSTMPMYYTCVPSQAQLKQEVK